ncbi:hypothetical protein [Deinococcus peraridilitoris]|uniref:Uncharacterized protein n=1 Tax=Deinococcus peraridilitoris (strain DSM 19664 / LMG 22246 / CIP 109416 / KR-200) TaxID=937777 RepID=L0A167_DEIPD|nr:hypothetical protein [Deinococcus peraridilitoris]AFZ66932.1 hypothetical protein Deipe_1388 [Deinococcus peraridilitoris DSM 19664]
MKKLVTITAALVLAFGAASAQTTETSTSTALSSYLKALVASGATVTLLDESGAETTDLSLAKQVSVTYGENNTQTYDITKVNAESGMVFVTYKGLTLPLIAVVNREAAAQRSTAAKAAAEAKAAEAKAKAASAKPSGAGKPTTAGADAATSGLSNTNAATGTEHSAGGMDHATSGSGNATVSTEQPATPTVPTPPAPRTGAGRP